MKLLLQAPIDILRILRSDQDLELEAWVVTQGEARDPDLAIYSIRERSARGVPYPVQLKGAPESRHTSDIQHEGFSDEQSFVTEFSTLVYFGKRRNRGISPKFPYKAYDQTRSRTRTSLKKLTSEIAAASVIAYAEPGFLMSSPQKFQALAGCLLSLVHMPVQIVDFQDYFRCEQFR